MSINPTAALFILLCAFDDLPIVSNMDGCFGHAYACCVGFVWNQEERACVKCQNGYSGINCSEICQYPNYGEDCQNECKCTQEMCDHSKGCQDISTDCPLSVLNMNNCHGNAHGCCDGYFWDRNACVKCPTGYTDKNCSEKCRYPSYGEECQLECQCNKTECDYIAGCIDVSTVTNLDKTSMLNGKTDPSLHSSKKLQSSWSVNKIISLCTLVIFSISIVLCGVHLIVTMKKRICEHASHLQTESSQNDAQYQEIPDNRILRNLTNENQDCTSVTQV